MRSFDAQANTLVVIEDDMKRPPWNAATFEEAVQRAYVEQGITRVTGQTTVAGRPALVVRSVPGAWRTDEPSSVTTAVVDAQTYHLYERTSSLPNGAFTQHETYRVTELLDASAGRAHMAMADHRGAKRKVTRRR